MTTPQIILQPSANREDHHGNLVNPQTLSEEINRKFLMATWVPVAAVCTFVLVACGIMYPLVMSAVDDRIGSSEYVLSSRLKIQIKEVTTAQEALKEQLVTMENAQAALQTSLNETGLSLEKNLAKQSAKLDTVNDTLKNYIDAVNKRINRVEKRIDLFSDAKRRSSKIVTAGILPTPSFRSTDKTYKSSSTDSNGGGGANVLIGFLFIGGIVILIGGALAKAKE